MSRPSTISSVLAARVVDAEVGGEPVGDLGEAAADDRDAVAEPLEGADAACGRRGEPTWLRTRSSSADASSPASSATRARSDVLEVELAAHRGAR